MNKMAKGAMATGLGVILLVGGGGTLATWNQAQSASMGSIVAGDLNLAPSATNGTGQWATAAGTKIPNIAAYKVVPGEALTYTQNLDLTLVGDQMKATLALTGAGVDNGFGTNVGVVTTVAKGAKTLTGVTLLPADSGVITATTTFTFKVATTGRDAVNATYNFSTVGYKLEQQAPTA